MLEATGEFEYENQLADIAGVLNVQHARLVDLAARAQRDGGWFGERIHSLAHWLTIHLGVAPGRARQIATIAGRADEFPVLMSTFRRGELSIDQVYEVAAKAPSWADQRVTEFATVATVRQLRRMIRDENFEHDPDEVVDDAKPRSAPISLAWDEHGHLRLPGALDTEQGLLVDAAANEARDSLFRAGHTTVTWSDALAEMARRSLAHVSAERRERFLPSVHVHLDTAAVQLTNGVSLPATLRDYLLCDATIRPVWERDCVPFGVGRSQRTVPERTRRVVEHRDQGCRVPGCAQRYVEIHHILHWRDGGPTETWNLLSLCRHHHKRHHLGHLLITGDADAANGIQFADAHGRTLATHPQPRPPDAPPPAPSVRYRHPSGERLQPRWINWAHPNAMRRRREQANALDRRTVT